MFKKSENFTYTVGKIDEIFEEKGNQFTTFREVYYNDSETPKYEIRRYSTNSEGQEVMGKGDVLMTETGPQELAKAIIRTGFGTTQEYIQELKDSREDFDIAFNKVVGPDDKRYDPTIKMDEVYDAASFIDDEDSDEVPF